MLGDLDDEVRRAHARARRALRDELEQRAALDQRLRQQVDEQVTGEIQLAEAGDREIHQQQVELAREAGDARRFEQVHRSRGLQSLRQPAQRFVAVNRAAARGEDRLERDAQIARLQQVDERQLGPGGDGRHAADSRSAGRGPSVTGIAGHPGLGHSWPACHRRFIPRRGGALGADDCPTACVRGVGADVPLSSNPTARGMTGVATRRSPASRAAWPRWPDRRHRASSVRQRLLGQRTRRRSSVHGTYAPRGTGARRSARRRAPVTTATSVSSSASGLASYASRCPAPRWRRSSPGHRLGGRVLHGEPAVRRRGAGSTSRRDQRHRGLRAAALLPSTRGRQSAQLSFSFTLTSAYRYTFDMRRPAHRRPLERSAVRLRRGLSVARTPRIRAVRNGTPRRESPSASAPGLAVVPQHAACSVPARYYGYL